ncbi:MAG: DNA adenine methylase, partial [Xenococcaceae cyanobacterium]
GKSQLLPEILKRMPSDYQTYYEPFLGGGAVFFSLQSAVQAIGNAKSVACGNGCAVDTTHKSKQAIDFAACLIDINQELINTYTVVRDKLDELIDDLKCHIYARDYYYELRDVDRTFEYKNWSDVRKASRFIYLNKTCFNGLYRLNSKGQFNTPIGRYTNPTILDEKNLIACSKALQNVELTVGDFQIIESRITSSDFCYFDPPYVPLTKTANFTGYSLQGFNEDMHLSLYHLCCRLDKRGVRFMLSNSSAPLVLELYKNFKVSFVSAKRAINSHGDKRGQISEVIVTNY